MEGRVRARAQGPFHEDPVDPGDPGMCAEVVFRPRGASKSKRGPPKAHSKVSGRENVDCENTMKMKIEHRRS